MTNSISIYGALSKGTSLDVALLVMEATSDALMYLDAIAGVAAKRFPYDQFSREWEYYKYPVPKDYLDDVVSAVEFWDKKYPNAKDHAGTPSHIWSRNKLACCDDFAQKVADKIRLSTHICSSLKNSSISKIGEIVGLSYALNFMGYDVDGSEIVSKKLIRMRIKLLKLIAEVIYE